jgi:hypothetical protein
MFAHDHMIHSTLKTGTVCKHTFVCGSIHIIIIFNSEKPDIGQEVSKKGGKVFVQNDYIVMEISCDELYKGHSQ